MITTLVLQLWNLLFGNDMLYNTTFRKLTKIWDHNGQYHLILWQDQSKTSLTTDYFNTCTSHNFAKFLDFIAERDQKLAQVGNYSQIATVMTWEPRCSNFSQCETPPWKLVQQSNGFWRFWSFEFCLCFSLFMPSNCLVTGKNLAWKYIKCHFGNSAQNLAFALGLRKNAVCFLLHAFRQI